MTTKQPATEPIMATDLPLKTRQQNELIATLGYYTRLKNKISALEEEAKVHQKAIRAVVENLGVDKFVADTVEGPVSVTYYPQVKESLDKAELIRLGVDLKVINRATNRTEFFVMKVTPIKG